MVFAAMLTSPVEWITEWVAVVGGVVGLWELGMYCGGGGIGIGFGRRLVLLVGVVLTLSNICNP